MALLIGYTVLKLLSVSTFSSWFDFRGFSSLILYETVELNQRDRKRVYRYGVQEIWANAHATRESL